MTFWIVPLLWECQTMKRNTVISALVRSVSSQFHGLLSLQYVSTQKQKVISSAGSHSAFSLGQHFPLPSGPPNWPRIPGAAVSMERLQSQGGWCSVLSLTELCYSSQFLTLPGPTLPPPWIVLLQMVPRPPWAHTASTENWRTQKYCTESLFGLEVLKPSAVPYWKLLWSGVFWNSKSCSFQKMNIWHFRKLWNSTDLLS